MASEYYIDRENGISYDVWDEAATADEYIMYLESLTVDKDWPPAGRMHIVDLRALHLPLEITEVSIKGAGEFVRSKAAFFTDFKVAVLISQTMDTGSILERLLKQFPFITLVFTRLDLACLWLGIDVVNAGSILKRLHINLCDKKVYSMIHQSQPDLADINSSRRNRQDELKRELRDILEKIKDQGTKHDEYMRLVERFVHAWEELAKEIIKNKKVDQ